MNDMTLHPPFLAFSIICFVLVLALDVVPRFLSGRTSTVLSLVGVGLHVPLMPLMLFAGFTLEWMILAYATSVFAFTLAHYIIYTVKSKRTEEEEGKI